MKRIKPCGDDYVTVICNAGIRAVPSWCCLCPSRYASLCVLDENLADWGVRTYGPSFTRTRARGSHAECAPMRSNCLSAFWSTGHPLDDQCFLVLVQGSCRGRSKSPVALRQRTSSSYSITQIAGNCSIYSQPSGKAFLVSVHLFLLIQQCRRLRLRR